MSIGTFVRTGVSKLEPLARLSEQAQCLQPCVIAIRGSSSTTTDANDCSGLIKWAFLRNGKSLPRSSQALASGGQPVEVGELQLGDIVTFYSDASPAGIYIGAGNMVYASTYGTPVKFAPISFAPIYNALRY